VSEKSIFLERSGTPQPIPTYIWQTWTGHVATTFRKYWVRSAKWGQNGSSDASRAAGVFFCPQIKRYFVIFPTADCRIITEAHIDFNYTNTRCWFIQLTVVSSCYNWLAQVDGIHCDTIRQFGTVPYSHSIVNYDPILYHFRDKSRY